MSSVDRWWNWLFCPRSAMVYFQCCIIWKGNHFETYFWTSFLKEYDCENERECMASRVVIVLWSPGNRMSTDNDDDYFFFFFIINMHVLSPSYWFVWIEEERRRKFERKSTIVFKYLHRRCLNFLAKEFDFSTNCDRGRSMSYVVLMHSSSIIRIYIIEKKRKTLIAKKMFHCWKVHEKEKRRNVHITGLIHG